MGGRRTPWMASRPEGRAPFANPAKDAAPASSSVRAEAEKNRSDLDPAKLALKAADLYFDR